MLEQVQGHNMTLAVAARAGAPIIAALGLWVGATALYPRCHLVLGLWVGLSHLYPTKCGDRWLCFPSKDRLEQVQGHILLWSCIPALPARL